MIDSADPFAPERTDERIIYKKDIRDFLTGLRENHHYIYAFLRRSPKSDFNIVADDEYRETCADLTIDEFFDTLDLFHPRLVYFSVRYRTYLYRDAREELCPHWKEYDRAFYGMEQTLCKSPEQLADLIDHFEGILAYQMREAILAGDPYMLDDGRCERYGFTPADLQRLGPTFEECRSLLMTEFHEDYRRLQRIFGIESA